MDWLSRPDVSFGIYAREVLGSDTILKSAQ
jgi:hypothetical protein